MNSLQQKRQLHHIVVSSDSSNSDQTVVYNQYSKPRKQIVNHKCTKISQINVRIINTQHGNQTETKKA